MDLIYLMTVIWGTVFGGGEATIGHGRFHASECSTNADGDTFCWGT
jgi:hypothetical protein